MPTVDDLLDALGIPRATDPHAGARYALGDPARSEDVDDQLLARTAAERGVLTRADAVEAVATDIAFDVWRYGYVYGESARLSAAAYRVTGRRCVDAAVERGVLRTLTT
jgi:hypothetical protein